MFWCRPLSTRCSAGIRLKALKSFFSFIPNALFMLYYIYALFLFLMLLQYVDLANIFKYYRVNNAKCYYYCAGEILPKWYDTYPSNIYLFEVNNYYYYYYYYYYYILKKILRLLTEYQTNTWLTKVFNNNNTRKKCEICSNLTIKTPERRQWGHSNVFMINFEHISSFCFC